MKNISVLKRYGLMALFAETVYRGELHASVRDEQGCQYLDARNHCRIYHDRPKICREYTNEYYRTVTHTKEFTITEVNEWYADSVTHFLSQEFADKFFAVPSLSSLPYLYEQGAWNNPPPFYFYPKEKVYHDLEKQSSLESQFFKNGN